MSSNPLNLAVRFALELAVLLAVGLWGWRVGHGWLQYVLALGLPLAVAIVWGVFRVPGDPGPAPVATPGILRLVFELALFAFATWALYDIGALPACLVFGIAVVAHYAASYDRVLWLIKR